MKPHVLKQLFEKQAAGVWKVEAAVAQIETTHAAAAASTAMRDVLLAAIALRPFLLNASRPVSLRIATCDAVSVFYHDAARPRS
jgi:hypothetical protein